MRYGRPDLRVAKGCSNAYATVSLRDGQVMVKITDP
jgi:hypothetical protein